MSHYVLCSLLRTLNSRSLYNLNYAKKLYTSRHIFKETSLTLGGSSNVNQDILLKSIRSSKETSDVLHYIGKHHTIMNYSHILQAFRIIFMIQKSDDTSMSNGEIIRSSEFHTLCNALKSKVRSLELNDTVDVIKALSYLGVSASSKLISILLQLVVKQVNDLSLQQIIFLDFLIKDFKSTPLVEALKIALPVVFQANLKSKVDGENLILVCDLLHYASRKNLSLECTDQLIDILMRQRNQLDLKSAMSVIRSVCDFRMTDESHRPLLHHALDVVIDNLDSCNFSDLDVLLSKLVSKYSQINYYFYHEEFFQSVSNFVVEKDCGFEEGVWTLRKLNRLGHINMKLLDYLAYLAEKEPCNLRSSRINMMLTFVRGFALADYKPKNWQILEPMILKNTVVFQDNIELPWVNYTRDLCTLGTWPLEVIETIFKIEFLEKYLSRYYNILDYLQVLALYQEVTTLCPEHTGLTPPREIIEKAMHINGRNVSQYPLLAALQKGLGGTSYVVSGVYTKLGHFIHHLIILRKGGFPVSMNITSESDCRTFVEDLKILEEHQMIAVVYMPSSFYCVNVERLKGPIRHHLSTLEAQGLVVVPVRGATWEMLLEHEKIPYLMREITQKCNLSDLGTAL